jgi:hypothetical protein
VIRQVLQAFEQSGHAKIGEIGKVQAGFIAMETLAENCFQVFVEGRNSAGSQRCVGVRMNKQDDDYTKQPSSSPTITLWGRGRIAAARVLSTLPSTFAISLF